MYNALIMLVFFVGLSACSAGLAIGDTGQHPTYIASSALGSAIAQASIGTVGD